MDVHVLALDHRQDVTQILPAGSLDQGWQHGLDSLNAMSCFAQRAAEVVARVVNARRNALPNRSGETVNQFRQVFQGADVLLLGSDGIFARGAGAVDCVHAETFADHADAVAPRH